MLDRNELLGDYNDNYKQFEEVTKKTDEYGSGQPSIVYRAEVETVEGNLIVPKVVEMIVVGAENGKIV